MLNQQAYITSHAEGEVITNLVVMIVSDWAKNNGIEEEDALMFAADILTILAKDKFSIEEGDVHKILHTLH